jgi:hypothetical protein
MQIDAKSSEPSGTNTGTSAPLSAPWMVVGSAGFGRRSGSPQFQKKWLASMLG